MDILVSKKKLLCFAAVLLASLAVASPQQSSPSSAGVSQSGAPQSGPTQTQPTASPASQPPDPPSQTAKPNPPGNQPATAAPNIPDTTVTVNTRLVQLDVVVTDHKGNPIKDLKKEDFTVLEGGQPQQIATFSFQQPKPVDASKPASPPHALPPGVYGNRSDAVASSQTALTVVLLDALNTPIADQAYARREMLQYLKTQHSGQSTAIYALTSRLLLLQDFTSDPQVLRAAIEKRRPDSSPLLTDADSQTAMLGASDEVAESIDSFERDQVNVQDQMRMQITLDAMKAIARSVSGYPGRKNLIWVSAAFPLGAAFDGDSSAFFKQTWLVNDIRGTATLLTDSQVSVYPVDARGLVGSPLGNATFTGRTRNGRAMNGPQLSTELNRRSYALTSSHDAMNQIAESTGGKAYYNRNDIDNAVALSIADGSTYYTIAYYPSDKNWDGKFRKVEVKLDRGGVQARYRRGYYATDPQQDAKLSKANVNKQIGEALGNPLASTTIPLYGAAFKVGGPAGKPASTADVSPSTQNDKSAAKAGETSNNPKLVPRQKVGVRFLVEPSGVGMQKVGNGNHFNLEFVVAAFKGDKVVGQTSETVDGNPKPETVNQIAVHGLLFNTSIEVPVGNCRLRLLVHDNQSGKIGTVDIPITDATPTVKQ